jgi:hypothetical protein
MSIIATIFWMANLLCDTAGQLAFKGASLRAGEADGLARWRLLLTGPLLWVGIGPQAKAVD